MLLMIKGVVDRAGRRLAARPARNLVLMVSLPIVLFSSGAALGKASTFIRRAENVEAIVTGVHVSSSWGDSDYNFDLRPPEDPAKAERFMNLFWVPDKSVKAGPFWRVSTYLDAYAEWINQMNPADYSAQCRACAGPGPAGTGCRVDPGRLYTRNPCSRLYKCWPCMQDVVRHTWADGLSRLYPQAELFFGDDDNNDNAVLKEILGALGATHEGCQEFAWREGAYHKEALKESLCGRTVRLSGWVTVDRQHDAKPEIHPISQFHVSLGNGKWRVGAFVDGSTEPGWITFPPWRVIQKIWAFNYRDDLSDSEYPGAPIIDLSLLQRPRPSAQSWGTAAAGGTDVIEARCHGPEDISGPRMTRYHLSSKGVRQLPSPAANRCGRLQVHLDRDREEGAAWVAEVTADWRSRRYDVHLKTELLTPAGVLTDNPLRTKAAVVGLARPSGRFSVAQVGLLVRRDARDLGARVSQRSAPGRSYVDLSERLEMLARDLGCGGVGDYTRKQHVSWSRRQPVAFLAYFLEDRKRKVQACLRSSEFKRRSAASCASYAKHAWLMETWRKDVGCAGGAYPPEAHQAWCQWVGRRGQLSLREQGRRADETAACVSGLKLGRVFPTAMPPLSARCEVRNTQGALFRWYHWRITPQIRIPGDEEFVALRWDLFTDPSQAIVVPDVRSAPNIRKVKSFEVWVPTPVLTPTWREGHSGELRLRVFRSKVGVSPVEVAHDWVWLPAPHPPSVALVPSTPTMSLTGSGPVYRLTLKPVATDFCGDPASYQYDWFVMNTPPGDYPSWGRLSGRAGWEGNVNSRGAPSPPRGAGPAAVSLRPGQGFTYRVSVRDPWGVESAHRSLLLAPPSLRLRAGARCGDKEVNHPVYGRVDMPAGGAMSYARAFSVPAELLGASPALSNGTVELCRNVVLDGTAVEDLGAGAPFPTLKDLRPSFQWKDLQYRTGRGGSWIHMPAGWYTVRSRGTETSLSIRPPQDIQLLYYQATLVARDQWGRTVASNYYGTNDFSFPDGLNKRLKELSQMLSRRHGPIVPCAMCDRGPRFMLQDELGKLLFRAAHHRSRDRGELQDLRNDVTAFMHRALHETSIEWRLGARGYEPPRRPTFRVRATRFVHDKLLTRISARIASAQLRRSPLVGRHRMDLQRRLQLLSRARLGATLARPAIPRVQVRTPGRFMRRLLERPLRR